MLHRGQNLWNLEDRCPLPRPVQTSSDNDMRMLGNGFILGGWAFWGYNPEEYEPSRNCHICKTCSVLTLGRAHTRIWVISQALRGKPGSTAGPGQDFAWGEPAADSASYGQWSTLINYQAIFRVALEQGHSVRGCYHPLFPTLTW